MARYIRLERNVVTEIINLTQEQIDNMPPEEDVVWKLIRDDLTIAVADVYLPEYNDFRKPGLSANHVWDNASKSWIIKVNWVQDSTGAWVEDKSVDNPV